MNIPLKQLREEMAKRHLDAYLVTAGDVHQSEYFSAHYEATRYLSHFTGESCTLVITADRACLWTDGRFFVQAEAQMDPEFELYRMGPPGVPRVDEYLADVLPENGRLGFDGTVVSLTRCRQFRKTFAKKGKPDITFCWKEDLVDLVWPDRPPVEPKPAWLLPLRYAGKSTAEKLSEIREMMAKRNADVNIVSSLDDVAWICNIRGDDIPYSPIVFGFALITMDDAAVFLNEGVANEEIRTALAEAGVRILPYGDIYDAVSKLPADSKVLMNERAVNMALSASLPEGVETINAYNPSTELKAVKNETEIKNIIRGHVKDGVAMVKFMRWLKSHIGKEKITEISASDVLEGFRREQGGNLGLSFATISGYGPDAAMMHYMATPETDAELKPEGFLLVDSGGQYYEGTTDITRTFALGALTEEQKMHFTAVVRGMLNLANAKWLDPCTGINLDYLAREPMWELGIDYRCGTGHGVGYLSNVHEGPQDLRSKSRPDRPAYVLKPGMIITDEPGIYLDYRYGIRIENELLVVKDEETEYGQFLRFRHVTYCPIDLDAIEKKYMTPKEIELLNAYHEMVYQTLKDHLNEDDAKWLREATRAI